MSSAALDRIAALDLIRGIAVLGILAVNVIGFAGPVLATFTPNWPAPAGLPDKLAFAGMYVVFEGKMRLLFTVLFGASMALFIERAEAAGRNGTTLQARRLAWLLVFGYLHFVLLWWGDILITYALLGFVALLFRRLPPWPLAFAALAFFVLWHGAGMVGGWSDISGAEAVRQGTAGTDTIRSQNELVQRFLDRANGDLSVIGKGFFDQALHRASEWALPLTIASASFGESLPLMALGIALYRTGFFAGEWPRRHLLAMSCGGVVSGGILTLALLNWAWQRDFPIPAMYQFALYWSAIPHLLMGLGYAAALMLAAPRLLASPLGQRLQAAGRMAFSKYIGTSLVMTGVFSGWGLALAGRYSHAVLPLFVVAMWALMLGWSKPWLTHFRQGPLEWLWRSLTERRRLAFRI